MDPITLQAAKRFTSTALKPVGLKGILNPVSSLPAPLNPVPTIGTPVSYGARGPGDPFGSVLTSPIAIPYFKGGLYSNGIDSARFRPFGWTLVDRFNSGQSVHPGGFTGGAYPAGVEFLHYGTAFEIRLGAQSGGGLQFQLYVDDVPMQSTVVQVTSGISSGNGYLLPITFAGKALRRIRLEFSRAVSFGGLVIAGKDFIQATDKGIVPQIYLCGDSYSDGANGVNNLDTYAMRLGKWLRAEMWIDGQGGTGFASNGGGSANGKDFYLPRINAAVNESRLKPDIVILQGSTNDGSDGTRPPNVGPNALACIAKVRQSWPTAKIIVPGLMHPTQQASLSNNNKDNNNNLKAAVTGANGADLFIDPVAELWFTGNGNAASPNNTGNADDFMSSDGIHGTQAFHELIGALLARRIVNFVQGIA